MRRRQFLAGSAATTAAALGGCLGGETDHETAFRNDVEERGVTIEAMDIQEGVVELSYESSNVGEDLGAVAVAFADRVDAGWNVDKLDSIVYADQTLTWFAEADWARAFATGEMDATEYGQRIDETLAPATVID